MANERTIEEWLGIFKGLYEGVDSKRSPAAIWIAATAHSAKMGEAIRKMHFADLMNSATHAFCWMASFIIACQRKQVTVFTLNESFSGIVAAKYPLRCGHCLEVPCHCDPVNMDQAKDKASLYPKLLDYRNRYAADNITYSVGYWQRAFKDIYERQMHMLTLESIGFHFLEEAGEELTAIRGLMQLEKVLYQDIKGIDAGYLQTLSTFEGLVEAYEKLDSNLQKNTIDFSRPDAEIINARLVRAKIDMFIEFADTFSWFCSILNKVSAIAGNCGNGGCTFGPDAFECNLAKAYLPAGEPSCPTCHQAECMCVFFPA